MASQKDVARRAGLTQATVSMALRNHPAVTPATKARVLQSARELNYRPNPLVSSLMTHIRAGRALHDQGTLAVLIANTTTGMTKEAWLASEVYARQYRGARLRAEQLGYLMEHFFQEDYRSSSHLDRVLYARGIAGVLLAPPQNLRESPIRLTWPNYAYAAVAYSWSDLAVHRSATHHRHNVDLAYRELFRRGYQRIGLSLPSNAVEGVDANWLAGFLYWQWKLPAKQRVPLFVYKSLHQKEGAFARWFARYRPDALLSLTGDEKGWMDALGIRVPADLGLACVNRPHNSVFSGVEENHEAVGAVAADLLIHQIQSNERGLATHPRLVLLEGTWVEGNSLWPRPPEPAGAVSLSR